MINQLTLQMSASGTAARPDTNCNPLAVRVQHDKRGAAFSVRQVKIPASQSAERRGRLAVVIGSVRGQRAAIRILLAAAAMMALTMAGCGKSDSATADGDESFQLDDLLGDIDLTEGGPADDDAAAADADDSETAMQEESAADELQALLATATSQTVDPDVSSAATIQLAVGNRYSLTKTVEQNLVQKSAVNPATASSMLGLSFDLIVREVTSEDYIMQVVYRRIQYAHDVAGQQLSWDSASNSAAVPAELAPYAAMIGQGFSWRLSRQNTIREFIGLQDFLQKCLQGAPGAVREQLMAQFSSSAQSALLDDSIALLPYSAGQSTANAVVDIGDQWEVKRTLPGQPPVVETTTCRLVTAGSDQVEVSLNGRIDAQAGVTGAVEILDGRSSGTCVIDRSTGLPLESSRRQILNLRVTSPDGQSLVQEKHVRTTVRMTARSDRSVVSSTPQQPADGLIVPAGGARQGGASASNAAQPADLKSTATARYPDGI